MSSNPKPTWLVYYEDINRRKIVPYDVMRYLTPIIKKLKKECNSRKEFSEALRREVMYRYWARCEYELIAEDDGVISLHSLFENCVKSTDPLVICKENDLGFDWHAFIGYLKSQRNWLKFDIYDQLYFRWDEFIDFCINIHFPYERKKEWVDK